MKIILKDKTEFAIDRLQANLKCEPGQGMFDDFVVSESEFAGKTIDEVASAFTDENVSEVTYRNISGKEITRKYTNVSSIRFVFGDTIDMMNIFLSACGEEGGVINEI